jgi:hypothetical protein
MVNHVRIVQSAAPCVRCIIIASGVHRYRGHEADLAGIFIGKLLCAIIKS